MESLDATATRALSEMLAGQPTTPAKINFAWTVAAGASLARHATMSWTGDGALRLRAESDAWRREFVRAKPILAQRLAALLGPDVIRTIVIEAGESGSRSARA